MVSLSGDYCVRFHGESETMTMALGYGVRGFTSMAGYCEYEHSELLGKAASDILTSSELHDSAAPRSCDRENEMMEKPKKKNHPVHPTFTTGKNGTDG